MVWGDGVLVVCVMMTPPLCGLVVLVVLVVLMVLVGLVGFVGLVCWWCVGGVLVVCCLGALPLVVWVCSGVGVLVYMYVCVAWG